MNRIAISIAALSTALAALSVAREGSTPPRIVSGNCSGCHHIDGNAQQPDFPRLAGLSAAYIEQQIAAYQAAPKPQVDELPSWILPQPIARPGARAGAYARRNMIGIAHALSAGDIKAAASWYASQTPAAGRAGDAALVDQGKLLYEKGVPAQNILACQDCHGPQARGMGAFPSLAGQDKGYILNQFAYFRNGVRQHAPEMSSISKQLNPAQERALAAYLQSR